MHTRHAQQGSVLPVALIMLMMLTLVASTSISMGTTSVQVVGNAQFREEAIAAGQQAIEKVISDGGFTKTAPGETPIDINRDGVTDFMVAFNPAPACRSVKPINKQSTGLPDDCYGSGPTDYCYDTTWEVTAQVQDDKTGASATVVQGVKVIVFMDSALLYCGI